MTVLTIATESYEKQHQINSNPTVHIEQSTLEYLHTAFLLYEYKQTHSKREYRALLSEYGWDKGSAEEKRSLKIAEYFQAFIGCPQHLAVLPISVLLRLCSQNYKVLIEELQDIPIGRLTCRHVLELIDERRLFLKSQNREEKEGNWRATPDGSRYYTFGKIMEDDHQTGVLTEKLIDIEDEEIEVVGNIPAEALVINQTPITDAEILADILRQASDYTDVRRGLYQYQPVKEEAWKMLSDLERKSVCQMLQEPIKKLSHAKREGLIVNFCEVESGGVYKIFTADCPLIERTISTHSLDRLLEELRVRQNCECN
ncbi:hypothetical protein [Calothrix sp. PCC 6303]|uniref:hypothetical protein n=1 Tax=Calothrix sp. PCC 6303 TaxID=1170562 RepID=UPI0002A01F6E|nr:hypothetical protein [Calothrix sp. PCC 6303]AFZ01552.1 hypothetical protein Cal6303_2570 [Calothrix sp. PCC 6303]